MGSLDWMSKELKPFLEQVNLYESNIDLRKYLWYSPKQQYSDGEIIYSLYILPILVAVSLGFFICLVSIVKEEKTFKYYIFLLLQALFDLLDDTVLLAETAQDLQTQLNAFHDYCKAWNLKGKLSKLKS
ncbi:Hypothetical predicted protein [Mytilus galloprovincialis]|uniref:Uncharacterized protein n=1 Tax=Mytilus galloprovincialis TaxID=29158 RepID=A0A8B6DAR2_MYTGA|nr:Hypothetical predicted protein [Mytilus galloprovincialis]